MKIKVLNKVIMKARAGHGFGDNVCALRTSASISRLDVTLSLDKRSQWASMLCTKLLPKALRRHDPSTLTTPPTYLQQLVSSYRASCSTQILKVRKPLGCNWRDLRQLRADQVS